MPSVLQNRTGFMLASIKDGKQQLSSETDKQRPPVLASLLQNTWDIRNCFDSLRFQHLDGFANRCLRLRCHRTVFMLLEIANADLPQLFRLDLSQRHRSRRRISCIGSRHYLKQQFEIANCPSHWSNNSQRSKWAETFGIVPAGGNSTWRGLEPADPAKVRGDPNRSTAIAPHATR